VNDRETGRPRGFGFVEYSDGGDGARAIEGLNGTVFGGRTLVVSEAREKPARSGGGGGGRGGRDRGRGGGRRDDW
jgi:cold-inducible RNA-binding protein